MRTRLVIAIPTRERAVELARLLASIGRQTRLPGAIVIVDDNRMAGQVVAPRLGVPVEIIRGRRRGPAWAHQTALDYLSNAHDPPDFILRLDDDLVIETPDFVERLHRVMCERREVGAIGGVYPPAPAPDQQGLRRTSPQPGHDAPVVIERIGGPGHSLTIAGMLRGEDSAQFFRWDRPRMVGAEHLYSSFMYRRAAAVAVGGFATWYSAQGQREETDFTYRLHLAGYRLLVDTGAVARHERSPRGGLREVAREALRRADEALFVERLRGMVGGKIAAGRGSHGAGPTADG